MKFNFKFEALDEQYVQLKGEVEIYGIGPSVFRVHRKIFSTPEGIHVMLCEECRRKVCEICKNLGDGIEFKPLITESEWRKELKIIRKPEFITCYWCPIFLKENFFFPVDYLLGAGFKEEDEDRTEVCEEAERRRKEVLLAQRRFCLNMFFLRYMWWYRWSEDPSEDPREMLKEDYPQGIRPLIVPPAPFPADIDGLYNVLCNYNGYREMCANCWFNWICIADEDRLKSYYEFKEEELRRYYNWLEDGDKRPEELEKLFNVHLSEKVIEDLGKNYFIFRKAWSEKLWAESRIKLQDGEEIKEFVSQHRIFFFNF